MTDDIKAIRDALDDLWSTLDLNELGDQVIENALCALDALEQAQKDAARWRWLRKHLSGDGPMISAAMRVIDQEYGWELDPAIDAAMSDAPGA